jgi:predicted nucleotidyltransferase component of viral defense system
MPEAYYLDKLYPFQDKILKRVEHLDLDFYLTGGTALGRCYLKHRYSDDIDFFVNDNDNFKTECRLAINALKDRWLCDIATTSETFARIFVNEEKISLKIDFVNDIPSHFGDLQRFSLFHRVDSWRNVLSNKLCALSRLEIKDIVDIVFIARKYAFDWETIIGEAKEKDLWIDPIDICRIIDQFSTDWLKTIKWIGKVNIEAIEKQIPVIRDDIFRGAVNSLAADGKL